MHIATVEHPLASLLRVRLKISGQLRLCSAFEATSLNFIPNSAHLIPGFIQCSQTRAIHTSRPIIPVAAQITAMLSASRSFARAAPRAIGRLANTSSAATRFTSSSLIKPSTMRIASAVRVSPFSSTPARRAAAESEVDDELSAKLDSEIQIEEDMKSSQQQPASVKDFLDNSPFELVDTEGQEVVKLVREFGQEK